MSGLRHGGYGTPTHTSWRSMKERCLNANHNFFHRYGGRGITLCARWLRFEDFLEDMGERPSMLHTLERLDNNGNYTKDNCEWRTRGDQANNRASNHLLTNNGVTLTISQWARLVNLKKVTILARLGRGWTVGRALETPIPGASA